MNYSLYTYLYIYVVTFCYYIQFIAAIVSYWISDKSEEL